MALTEPRSMTVVEFLAWEARQPEKWELIDGVPVLRTRTRGMAGGSVRHGLIAANIIAALRPRLRGGPCVPLSSDVKVSTAAGPRYPDVTIDCGPRPAGAMIAEEPRVLFEVLSPSNKIQNVLRLIDDYQGMQTVQEIVFVSQDEPVALVWRRGAAGWARTEVSGETGDVVLDSIGCTLPLTEVFEGVTFEDPPLPRAPDEG